MGVIEGDFRPLRVFVADHERYYDFSPYLDVGEAFLAAVSKQFHAKITRGEWSRQTSLSTFADLGRLLRYIKDEVEATSRFRQSLQENYTKASRKDWQEVLRHWRSQVAETPDIRNRTKDNIIARVRPFISTLANSGVIPQLGDVLLGFDFDSTPKRTLAELTNGAMSEAELTIRLKKLNKDVTENEIPGAIDCFSALASEAEIDLSSELSIPEQVLALLDRRLAELRRCAEADLITEFDKIEQGSRLAAQCDIGSQQLAIIANSCRSPKELRELFPEGQVGLARLLTYYRSEFGSLRPRYDETTDRRHIGRWLSGTEKVHGGSRAVSAYLYASRRFLTAASVIVLHDTAMNVESCRTLRRDCLGPPTDGFRKLSWQKRRAHGLEDQYELMPINVSAHKLSAVNAIEMVLSGTEVLARNTTHADRHGIYLFLSADGSTRNSYLGNLVRLAANETFLKRFRDFLTDHNTLSGFAESMTQDSIRPSLLLREALRTKSISAVRALGKHASTATSFRYVNRMPLQIAGNASIQSFMQSLQVLATHEIENICEKAGIPNEKYESLKAELFDTGLGVYCTDPMAGIQDDEGYREGSMCGAIDKCLACPNLSKYVFATPQNIAHLLAWRAHLRAERERMLSERPQRWIDAWEPWLAFTEIAIEKLQAGQFKMIFQEAESLAEMAETAFPDLW